MVLPEQRRQCRRVVGRLIADVQVDSHVYDTHEARIGCLSAGT
jgi:hypothetical protein